MSNKTKIKKAKSFSTYTLGIAFLSHGHIDPKEFNGMMIITGWDPNKDNNSEEEFFYIKGS